MKESYQNLRERLRGKYRQLQEIRTHNQTAHPVGNALLTWLFPLLIVCLAELNQDVDPSAFFEFCAERPGVLHILLV